MQEGKNRQCRRNNQAGCYVIQNRLMMMKIELEKKKDGSSFFLAHHHFSLLNVVV